MKFSNKLSLALLVSGTIVLIVLSFFVYRFSYNSTIRSQSLHSQTIANSVAGELDLLLLEKIKIGLTLANTPIIKNALQSSNLSYGEMADKKRNESIQFQNTRWKSTKDPATDFILKYTDNPVANMLKNQQTNLDGEYGEIFLTDKFGALVASTAKLSTFFHGQKYWWLGSYKNGKGAIFFDDRGYDDSVGGYVLGLVIPVRNGTEIIGILKCNLNILGSISDLLVGAKNNAHGKYKLTRSGGMVVFEEGHEPLSTQVHNSIFQRLKNNNTESFILKDSDKQYLVGFAEVQLTTGTSEYGFGGSFESIDHKKGNTGESWYVLNHSPLNVAKAQLLKLIKAIFLSGAFIIVLLAICSYWFGKKIGQPLALLDNATEKLGEGDFEHRIKMIRNDEFGKLAHSFNNMAERLQQSTTSIELLHEEVQKRTDAEAQALNSNELLQCIDRLRRQFIKEPDPFLLFPQFLEQLLKLTNSKYGFVGDALIDEKGNQYLKLYALSNLSWNTETAKLYEKYHRQGLEFRKMDNIFGLVVTSGEPVLSNDPANDSRGAGFPKGHPEISSFLGIPVYYGKQLVGEVGLANRPGGYDQELLDWISPVIAALGQIIVERWGREARKTAEAELLKVKKLEATSLFAGGLAHDFNNLLTSIVGNIEMTRIQLPPGSPCLEMLADAKKASQQAREICQDFTTFATIGKSVNIQLSIKDLLNKAIENYSKPETVQITFTYGGDLHPILGDTVQLQEVLSGLLENSCEAIEDQGTIRITAENYLSGMAGNAYNLSMPDGNYIRLTLQDDGSGISEEDLPKIYDPYYSTKTRNAVKGTGLGLSMVYAVIKQHNSFIHIESETGKGTTVYLFFPDAS